MEEIGKKALLSAVAIELIHNFSLIHDDIEDRSELRRGRLTLWKVYGVSQAINSGDALFALAQINMLKGNNNIDWENAFRAANILNKTCLNLTGGQHLDISFESEEDISHEDYLKMIGGKTASLISASTQIGGIFARTSENNIRHLIDYGKALGMAFQIWDDWLGLWGNDRELGKSTHTDLKTRKKTYPVIYAMEKNKEFRNLFLQEKSDGNLIQLTKSLASTDAKEKTEQKAKEFTIQAMKSLNSLQVSDQKAFETMVELTEKLINRKN